MGIGIIGRYIIDGVNRIRLHQPLPQHFWWLVGSEMALAVLTGILSRAVDYFDNLLADRYTHHVSVEVMRKAAALDVTVYEDPVFYDRLERARVQATDRLAMIQQMGRLIQQIGHGHRIFRGPRLVLAVPAFAARRRHHSRLSRRKPLRLSHLREELPPDADPPPDGLPAPGGRQQGSRQGTEALQPERLSHRPLLALCRRRIYEENVALNRRRLFWGGLLAILGQLGYYGAYAYSICRTIQGRYSIGDLTLITTAIMQAMAQYPAGILHRVGRRRPGALPHRPAGLL